MGGDVPQPPVIQQQPKVHQVQDINNLLDMSEPATKNIPVIMQSTTQPIIQTQETNLLESQVPVANPGIFNFFDNTKAQQQVYQNIVIPVVEVLSAADTSREGKYGGLTIRAAFER